MPRFDAKIEVLCDECDHQDFWEPEFSYHDWSGKNGSYDTSKAAFSAWCRDEGWSENGDKTICPDCVAMENEE